MRRIPSSSVLPFSAARRRMVSRYSLTNSIGIGIAASGQMMRSAPAPWFVSSAYAVSVGRNCSGSHFSSCGTAPVASATSSVPSFGTVNARSRAANPPSHTAATTAAATARSRFVPSQSVSSAPADTSTAALIAWMPASGA